MFRLCRLWGAFVLVAADSSHLSAHLDANHSRTRIACAVVVDVVWVALQSQRLTVPSDVALLVFITLFVSHGVSLWTSASSERAERSAFLIQRALEAAVRERQQLLEDLFPPAVVASLIAGDPVPPAVTSGAVVLYCDLVGFTRMCSGMTPLQIMRAMNEVYSVFE